MERTKNQHKISLVAKKWIPLSTYTPNSDPEKQLHNDFNKNASEICASFEKFDIIKKKIEIIEMDETPAFGTEPVVKIGIKGIVECK